ncbi:unnamed protein product [Miscanthus lutarioriparius]|uniref:Peptidase A1 domain-containing protein n=1 Tax=Miscanthus lutarioriparius TaxID=422564 RepID=A0A811QDH3_9POAL|nr:unnamed protein product [Miscanthus lutarioriparius]
MAAMLFLILALMISFLATPVVYSDRPAAGFRATMIRTEKAINFTQAARRSHERMSMLAARLDAASGSGRVTTQAPLQVDGAGYEYNMVLSIGTPPQKLLAMADTGSDLSWIKCGACSNCTPEGPSYYPGMSTSFSVLPCSDRLCRALMSAAATCGFGGAECEYIYGYGLEADPHVYTRGFLANETFTLGDDRVLGGQAVPGVGFGCTTVSEGIYIYGASSGIVGLGRGPLSLVSHLNVGAFSYCLSGGSMTSPLLFGSLAVLAGAGVHSTPLLAGTGTYYSVSLERISVGDVTTIGPGRSGYGMVLDSGTTFTYLVEPFYMLARAAVLNQTTLARVPDRYGFEACFQASGGGVWDVFPAMVLHFDGADMALPTSSCFGQIDDDGVICWMVQRSPSLSIISNVMQRDYHIRYDVDEGVVSFQAARCDNL